MTTTTSIYGYHIPHDKMHILHDLTHRNERAIKIICKESARQKTNIDGVIRLANAYALAYRESSMNYLPSMKDIIELATIIEPINARHLRHTEVTFASGGSAASASSVEEATTRLFEQLDEQMRHDIKLIDEFVRSFESIHPFMDGNGRTAWLIRTWLTNTWEDPQPLPYYTFY